MCPLTAMGEPVTVVTDTRSQMSRCFPTTSGSAQFDQQSFPSESTLAVPHSHFTILDGIFEQVGVRLSEHVNLADEDVEELDKEA